MKRSSKQTLKSVTGRTAQLLVPAWTGPCSRMILMYHRVLPALPDRLHDPALVVTAGTLDMHLRELARWFTIVPLAELASAGRDRGRLCSITFDDGWADNYEHALPVLRRHGVPATVFVPAGLVDRGQRFWFQQLWDLAGYCRLAGMDGRFIAFFEKSAPEWHPAQVDGDAVDALTVLLKRLPAARLEDLVNEACRSLDMPSAEVRDILTREQMTEMSGQAITFGSHGLSHRIITTLDRADRQREISGSLERLQSSGLAVTPFLSYPNGNWDREAADLAKEAGYQGAVTTALGCVESTGNAYGLPRIPLHEEISDTPQLFWFRLFQAWLHPDRPVRAEGSSRIDTAMQG